MSGKHQTANFVSNRKDERQNTAAPLLDLYTHTQKASRLASALHSMFEERDEIYLDSIDIIGVRELAREVLYHANSAYYLQNIVDEQETNQHLAEVRENKQKAS